MHIVDTDTSHEKQPETIPGRRFGVGQQSLILLVLVVLALARGLLYATVTPPWQTPDEPWHFEYARLVADEGRLVTNKDLSAPLQQSIIDSMIRFRFWDHGYYKYPYDATNPPQLFNHIWEGAHQIHQQPLYYVVCAIIVWPWLTSDVAVQLYVLRLLSVVLFAGVVAAAFLTAREIFPTNPVPVIAISAGVLWHPTFTFVSNSVNNDNLANLFTAWLIWLLARWYMRGFSALQGLGIVALLALGTFTKRTTLFTWPLVAAAVPLYLWGRGSRRIWLFGSGIIFAGLIGLVTLVLSGHDVPLLSRLVSDLGFGADVVQNPEEYRLFDPALYAAYAGNLFVTFWAAFGWVRVLLERTWYQAIAAINLLAVGGLSVLAARVWRDRDLLGQGQRRVLVLLSLAVLLSLGIIMARSIRLQTWLPGDLPQGRYLFPVVVPIVTLLVVGLWQWIPSRIQHLALLIFMGTLVAFDMWCLVGYIIPAFYQN